MAADRISLLVRLTPRGGRDAVDGWGKAADGTVHLKVRVAAPPIDGKANTVLLALLAKTLGVSKSCLAIESGETARLKRISVRGNPDELRAKLAALGEAT